MKLTVCPCCGFKFEGDLREGCVSCGAQAVGEPLARPAHELPSYGRGLFVGVIGAAAVVTFLVATLVAFLGRPTLSFDFLSIRSAAETAAWSLKWIALPLAIGSIWLGWRVCASIRHEPSRFIANRIAHSGLAASVLFAILVATGIGVTVPKRFEQRQQSSEAAFRARLYTHNRAFMEYRASFGTYPTELADLKNLPDPDGSIKELIVQAEQASYKPWTELAATTPTPAKPRGLRDGALRPATLNSDADASPGDGVPFTNYELRLPGEDKVLGTADDWMIRDGVVTLVSTSGASSTFLSTGTTAP
jgi:hypothetical protein